MTPAPPPSPAPTPSFLSRWNAVFDPQAPIVIIGAGRSGSTLLARILAAHPAADVRGETNFLALRLWSLLWTDRFWLDWQRFVDAAPGSSRDAKPALPDAEAAAHQRRIGAVIAQSLAALLEIRADARAWGFKEVWNGSASHDHPWSPYDAIFPRAVWTHIVRHPLDFARSCADWNRDEATPGYVAARLRDWAAIVRRSRDRQTAGRFVEVRYEDLVAGPRAALEPILVAAGLPWSERCLGPLDEHRLRSQRRSEPLPWPSPADPALAPALELCRSLGYAVERVGAPGSPSAGL